MAWTRTASLEGVVPFSVSFFFAFVHLDLFLIWFFLVFFFSFFLFPFFLKFFDFNYFPLNVLAYSS
jgi:hypothetical protein